MKVTAHMGVIIAVIFAVACFGVAFNGFAALGGLSDPEQIANTKGFAGFWAFLGGVAVVFGLLSWWIGRTEREDE